MEFNHVDFDTYFKHYPDENGYFGPYGGAYVSDELKAALQEITEAYFTICKSRKFIAELRRIRQEFQGRPTPISHLERLSNAIGNVQLEVGNGQTANRIIVVPGANMAITPADVAFLEEGVAEYDLVVLQLEIPMEINLLVASYAHAKGVPVMLNSAPAAPLPPELLPLITYISPNETEASLITGLPVETDEQVLEALRALRGLGVANALITLGSRGVAYLDSEDHLTVSPALKNLPVKDPTAAGDSFVGAFSTAVSLGLPMEQVLRFANHTAALTVCRMGAQPSLPTIGEVLKLMQERGQDVSALLSLAESR